MKAEHRPIQINDRIEVFSDPVTRQDREGIANVVEILIADEGEEVYCLVSFEGDEDYQFPRWVHPSSVIAHPVSA